MGVTAIIVTAHEDTATIENDLPLPNATHTALDVKVDIPASGRAVVNLTPR